MKPTPPEDRELEQMSAEVSEHYRAAGQEEPPPRLDAAVRMAARREVAQPPRPRRTWQMPASVAAVLVIGVSLVMVARENEPPLPSMERPGAGEPGFTKPAPPQATMKQKSQARERPDLQRERPSRERTARPDREAAVADQLASVPEKTQENLAPSTARRDAAQAQAGNSGAVSGQAPAASAPALEQKQAPMADSRISVKEKSEGVAAAPPQDSPRAEPEARAKDAPFSQAEAWLHRIDALLAKGDEAQARSQLLDFRKQYPRYALPPRLQALLPQEQPWHRQNQ